MPTSLTDQMFNVEPEPKSLSDQMFEQKPKSLTSQMFETEDVTEESTVIVTQAPTTKTPVAGNLLFKEHTNRIHKFLRDNAARDLGVDESGRPTEDLGLKEKVGNVIGETLKGFTTLVTHPVDTIKGGIDIALSVPGFLTGLVDAGVSTVKEIIDQVVLGQTFNLEEVYNAASEGMQRSMEFFEPGKELIIGEPTEESQLATQVIMAPLTGMSMLGHKIAGWEGFEDYPNIRGAAKFAGDIGGIAVMGGIMHGRSAKAKFAKDVEGVVRKGEEIIAKERSIEGIPDELIRQTQMKVLNIEKVQLELRAKEISDMVSKDALIREELGRQAEHLAREKLRPIAETKLKKPVKEVKLEPEIKLEPIIEVDQATGTSLPVIEGKSSPFFQDATKTLEFKGLYEERARAVSESPEMFTQKVINDVNQWFHNIGEINIEAAREGLSSLAARADEMRAEFLTGEDHLIWKETVSEASTWARRLDRLDFKPSKIKELTRQEKIDKVIDTILKHKKEKPGVTLNVGVDPVKGFEAIVKGARRVSEYTKTARGLKAFKPIEAARLLKEEFNRAFVDRSGNIRNELLNNLGSEGYEVVQKMYLAKGASSISANLLKQMQREVYSGLSKAERNILDNVILADRVGDIAKYKTPKQFKYPKGLEPNNVVAYSELFGRIEKLSPERTIEIRNRARSYFEWMKKPLKDMRDSELITPIEYDALVSHNYRRLKLIDVYDRRQSKLGKKGRTVYDSGVEALSRGRDTDVFEPSSEIMALEVFNRAYGRILNNEANRALLDVSRSDPQNPFVRVKENKGDIIPSGWQRTFVYEKGERRAIYLSPEMSKEWITSNPETTYRLSQLLRYSSGSPVLRTFATGINWGFALANLPRDVMHTWFAARQFDGKEWSGVYSPHAPMFGLQIGSDLTRTFSDAALRKGRYKDYINEGGGMEFLVHQGRLFQRGRHIEGPIDKVYDFMGYFGETSEIMTRLAIRDRVIKNRASEQGITVEQARRNKVISREATFAARDYMDFGQGGGVAKALDNGLPYLNAAIQGTRGLFRSFKPGSGTALSSTYKLSQFAALTTGLTIAAWKMSPNTMENLEGNIDAQNNLIIPLGDEFGFEDARGQIRYPYIKIPLDPGQKFFKTFFEASAAKWLGKEVDVNRVVDSLKEQSPVGVTELPPTISGVLGYVTNKDFWLNEDIWTKTDRPFSYPQSKEEFIPGRTPQAYVDLGRATGLSPERTRYAVEELVTNGTVWSFLLGQGYEELFSNVPKEQREQHLAMVLARTPIAKRFIGVTNPFSKFAGKIEKAEEKVVMERFIENRGLDTLAEGFLFKKNVNRKEVFDYMKGFKDKKTFDRLKERFRFQEVVKDLPERSFWLRLQGIPLESRAQVFVDRLEKASPEQKKQLWKEYAIVSRAKGIVTKSFRREVGRLRK